MLQWNLGELFEVVVDAVPHREAVVDGTERTSFVELDRRANSAAELLTRSGVGPGDRVGLLLRNGRPYLELLIASFKLGATPFNVHDRYTADELRVLLDDAQPRLVVHEPDLGDRLAGGLGSSGTLAVDDDYERAIGTAPAPRPAPGGRSGDDRYILYTGGTTGRPRGVVWRHHDLLTGALATAAGEESRPLTARGHRRAGGREPAALPSGLAAQPRCGAVERAGHPVRRRHRRARRSVRCRGRSGRPSRRKPSRPS